MSQRGVGRRTLVLALAGLAMVAVLVPALTPGLLFGLPALLLLLPLLRGRYVGERCLERLSRARVVRRPRATASRVVLPERPSLLARGGLLLASGLAVRPPPAVVVR